MEIRLITPDGVARHEVDDLPRLLDRRRRRGVGGHARGRPGRGRRAGRGVRLPPAGGAGLRAAHTGAQGARLPRPRVRRPARAGAGAGGHVHYVELDQFVGARYLVTVHGPVNPAVDPAAARVETDAVAARLDGGRFAPDVRATSCPRRSSRR